MSYNNLNKVLHIWKYHVTDGYSSYGLFNTEEEAKQKAIEAIKLDKTDCLYLNIKIYLTLIKEYTP